jgi:hypothetical protein
MKFTPSGTFFVLDRCTLISDFQAGILSVAVGAWLVSLILTVLSLRLRMHTSAMG